MNSQCHADRQDIHTVCGVVGDLSNGLANDGGKIGVIGIEAQLGAAPDIGHMMQAMKKLNCDKHLDKGNSRAYYFGRRTAEKRLFTRPEVSYI